MCAYENVINNIFCITYIKYNVKNISRIRLIHVCKNIYKQQVLQMNLQNLLTFLLKNVKKKVIQIMMIIAKKHGYSYKETEEIIKEFYLKK